MSGVCRVCVCECVRARALVVCGILRTSLPTLSLSSTSPFIFDSFFLYLALHSFPFFILVDAGNLTCWGRSTVYFLWAIVKTSSLPTQAFAMHLL